VDVWLLDLERWEWSRRPGNKAPGQKVAPPLPRIDGAAWAERQGLYMAWGQEANAPADLIRRTFVCRTLTA
jgi:hypothetical protein